VALSSGKSHASAWFWSATIWTMLYLRGPGAESEYEEKDMNILRAVSEQLHVFTLPDHARTDPGHAAIPIVAPEAPNRFTSAIEVPHCCFYCSWCASPILLPHESLGMPFGGPLVRKIEARSVGTVCMACGHAGSYSLFRGGVGYTTRHKFVPSRTIGTTMLLGWMPCEESTCVFPLPFFVAFDEKLDEANVKEFAARWYWEDLMCPVSHMVAAPQWINESGPHRSALDVTQLAIKPPR
jgi:hypothetical protein